MKKYRFFLYVIVALATVGCAFVQIESPEDIPKPFEVDTNSVFFFDVSEDPIVFSGDPAADFGAQRVLITDPSGDYTNDNYEDAPSTNFHDIEKIYMAFTKNNLLLGFASPSYPDGTVWDKMYSGGSYIFIDNGLTTGKYSYGPTLLDNAGILTAELTGTLGNFDQPHITSGDGHKFSVWVKHYRPSARDMPVYRFVENAVEKEMFFGGSATVGWDHYTEGGVTELSIPLHFIFGDETTAVPTFYVAFRTDGALTEANVDDATNGGAVDWALEQDGVDITNWFAITNLTF